MKTMDIEGVRHSYGLRTVLTDIYIHCARGETVGILGLNGSGKTTLFRIITGILKPESAVIRMDGMPMAAQSMPGRIAYMAQESFLPQDMRVSSCIGMFLGHGDEKSYVLDDRQIKEMGKTKIGSLSPGERRYLELLLVLSKDRDFIILDEPFSELDPMNTEKALSLIREVRIKRGILLTDQDYRSVLSITTSISLLTNGYMEHIDKKEDLVDRGYLSRD